MHLLVVNAVNKLYIVFQLISMSVWQWIHPVQSHDIWKPSLLQSVFLWPVLNLISHQEFCVGSEQQEVKIRPAAPFNCCWSHLKVTSDAFAQLSSSPALHHGLQAWIRWKTVESVQLLRWPLSRWRPLRWCCCPAGAWKTAWPWWRSRFASPDWGFLLLRCRCPRMSWRTDVVSSPQWELLLGGIACSCSVLYSVCRKENTAASSHPWLRRLVK